MDVETKSKPDRWRGTAWDIMQDEHETYFFDVQVGEERLRDAHGIPLTSIDEARCDAVEIAAAMMVDAPEPDRPVTVTVRSAGKALLRVRCLLTVESCEAGHQG